jgi:small subunit ribosomal protein S19
MIEEQTKKQFLYRGKTIEELKELSVREFTKFLDSKERRYVLRNFQEVEKFLNSCKEKIQKNKPIKTHIREMIIMPQMIGLKISVHNGKEFVPIEIMKEMIGHRLGEFALTRGRVKHNKAGVGATKGSKAKAKK